jgi:hypothetical protein
MRGAEEREVGRRPAREEAGSVPIRVDEVEYVYIYWTTCWVGLDHWALLGWAAWLHCIFYILKNNKHIRVSYCFTKCRIAISVSAGYRYTYPYPCRIDADVA